MNMTWLLRMAKWARHPPSPQRVKLVLGVIAACLVLYAIEYAGFWPDALQINQVHKP